MSNSSDDTLDRANATLNQGQDLRLVTLFTATCIAIANMVGTGVFTSLGFQVIDIQSGFSLLFLWLIGGIFALSGALCYGELGAAMPRSGGEYHYLSQIYHPVVGFLSGWVSITVGFAAPIAAAAMALGAYFSSVFLAPPLAVTPGEYSSNVPLTLPITIATIAVIAISLLHCQNLKLGSIFQQAFTLLKVLLIAILILSGLFLATPQDVSFLPSTQDFPLIFSSPFAISLVYVTYSYSGWNASVYLASEIKEPEKNLPRSLLIGTAIVMVLYLLLNFIFLYSTPIDKMAGELEVGAVAASHIFGNSGGKIMSLLIAFGLISSISSMVWAGPRVTQVIGEDIPFFRILAKKNRHGVPHYAILLQLGIVIALLITATFEAVIAYLGFTLTLSSFMTVLGVFVHRWRYPDASRPYRTWGYPVTPIIFLAISLWILIFLLMGKPIESLAGLATIALGLPFYWIAFKRKLT